MKHSHFCKLLLCIISICAIALLAGCGSKAVQPVTNTVTNRVTNVVTNTVTKFVTNTITQEVVKEVPVPAAISQQYIEANTFLQKVRNATSINSDQALFGMEDVKVTYILEDAIRQAVLEDRVKAKFESTLRKRGVPINPNSRNVINVRINGFYNDTRKFLSFSIQYEVVENQLIFRNGECHKGMVTVWTRGGSFGIVGKAKANESLLNSIEKGAEVIANDYLSANPKEKKIQTDIYFLDAEARYWEQELSKINAGKDWTPITSWDSYGLPILGKPATASDAAAEQVRRALQLVLQAKERLQKQIQ